MVHRTINVDTMSRKEGVYMKSNFFDIPNPDAYKCTIWRYAATHSLMYVRAEEHGQVSDRKPNVFWLRFIQVHSFEGPTQWLGANFCVATEEESKELWWTLYPKFRDVEDVLHRVSPATLLILATNDFRIRILSDWAEIDASPPSFPIEKWIMNTDMNK